MIEKILSGYKLIEKIGTGGMSSVYLGRNVKDGSLAAVKVLKKQYTQEKEHVDRFFKREIDITRNLNHKNIVSLINYGNRSDTYYLIYEYIQGVSLDIFMANNKKLSISNIEKIFLQILSGLAYAHSKGIIHRDVKPQNILITSRGIVKITDFGIAKALSSKTITQTGVFMGSPGYISPEQADGKKVDIRADIYSVGIILFELLVGKLPFRSDTPWGLVHKHIYDAPPDINKLKKNIPLHLSYIVSICLNKKPSERFNSVAEIVEIIKSKSINEKTIIKPVVVLNQAASDEIDRGKVEETYRQTTTNQRYAYNQPLWILILLTILTAGLYQIIWFYKNWRDLNEYNSLGTIPILRTFGLFVPLLGIILVYGQFSDIREYSSEGGIYNTYPPGWLFFGWLMLGVMGSMVIYLGLLMQSVFLLVVQNVLNKYWQRHQSGIQLRTSMSPLEIVILVLSVIFWIIIIATL